MLSALRKIRLATAVLPGLSDRCRIQRPRNALDFEPSSAMPRPKKLRRGEGG